MERTGTNVLSFMSPGGVSSPFVVVLGIPLQTTNRPHKAQWHQVTEESRCVCVCVSAHHVFAPVSASPPSTADLQMLSQPWHDFFFFLKLPLFLPPGIPLPSLQ